MRCLESADDHSPGEVHAGGLQDTVGAVAWDMEGGLAAGVSRSALLFVNESLQFDDIFGCTAAAYY